MIKAVIIVNTSGKRRLVKFYEELPTTVCDRIVDAVYRECSKRPENSCNFIENAGIWEAYRLIYRHYATLYIVFIVDEGENELSILDLIQIFVEVLDKVFQNVCELDLIFHSEKAYEVLEEIVTGGMVADSQIAEIWRSADSIIRAQKQS